MDPLGLDEALNPKDWALLTSCVDGGLAKLTEVLRESAFAAIGLRGVLEEAASKFPASKRVAGFTTLEDT